MHEPPQGDQLRGRRSAIISPPTAGSTPRAMRRTTTAPAPCSPPMWSPGCRRRSRKAWEALTKNHGAAAEGDAARPPPQAARRPRHPRRAAPRRRDDRAARADRAGPVQARAGDEPRHRSRATRPTGCASCGRCATRSPTRTASTSCCSSTACRSPPSELKTDFTQSVEDAVDQYRFDRHPRPKGQAAEPLLSFPSGALVHFAVSNSEVHMTTQLDGPATRFLPFNQGDNGAQGQPAEPAAATAPATCGRRSGSATAGWKSSAATWSPSATSKKQIKSLIFPRYHQLDATRKLQAAVLAEGAGRQVPDPALGGLGQDQLHRLVRALPGRPARRQQREAVRHRASWSPTAT